MTVADFLNRTLFSFLFVRKTRLLSKLPTRGEVDQALADLTTEVERNFRVRSEQRSGRLTLMFLGWGLPLSTRRISIEYIAEGSVLISNNPSSGAQAFGLFAIAFFGLYEILVFSDIVQCIFRASCVLVYYDALLIIAPLVIYGGMVAIYGLQYLPSVRLYNFVIAKLAARMDLRQQPSSLDTDG
jgi:hypothetical protein